MPVRFDVKIWGSRGSIATPGPNYALFGGNTPCVEVNCGSRRLVFDAGTGIRALGHELAEDPAGTLDILYTHYHYDHIEGLPFFQPLHDSRWKICMHSGHMGSKSATAGMLKGFMREPYFPVDPRCFSAEISYADFTSGETIDMGDGIVVRTAALNHPGGATGYRIEFDGRAACYVTDTEHVPGRPDENVLRLIDGAGVVIYDATYDDEVFEEFKGYGHSTWQEGARLCDRAEARTLVVFHHRPSFDDAQLGRLEEKVKAHRESSFLARDGMVLTPDK